MNYYKGTTINVIPLIRVNFCNTTKETDFNVPFINNRHAVGNEHRSQSEEQYPLNFPYTKQYNTPA